MKKLKIKLSKKIRLICSIILGTFLIAGIYQLRHSSIFCYEKDYFSRVGFGDLCSYEEVVCKKGEPLKIEKKEDIEKSNQDAKNVENKIVTEIQKIKKVNTTIGNNTNNEDTNNKETDTNNFKKITRQDIQDIKKFIIDEYGVKEKCLEIN